MTTAAVDFAPSPTLRPPCTRLEMDECHVWAVDLKLAHPVAERLTDCLSAAERERAAQFVFDTDRLQFAISRAALRCLLSVYTGCPPARHRFGLGRYSKPFLVDDPGLEFNVSHSSDLALFAFARLPIGVDVERVRGMPDWDSLARSHFPREYQCLVRLPPAQRELGFFLCWTRKEAYVKALGEGLYRALDSFEVNVEPGEPACLRSPSPSPWRLHHLSPAPGFVGALASPSKIARRAAWRVEPNLTSILECCL